MTDEKNYRPYTYLIGWSKHNVWYYGSEYSIKGKVANPDNLWLIYFTSSKHVKDFRKNHGDPDVIQVRKVFSTAEDTRKWEHKVLRRSKVIFDSKWLNETDNKAIINSPETILDIAKKVSIKLKGRKLTPEHVTKVKETKRLHPKRMTPEERAVTAECSRNVGLECRQKRSIKMSSKIWIRTDTECRRIDRGEPIPDGWRKGRINVKRSGLWEHTEEWKRKKAIEARSRKRNNDGRFE